MGIALATGVLIAMPAPVAAASDDCNYDSGIWGECTSIGDGGLTVGSGSGGGSDGTDPGNDGGTGSDPGGGAGASGGGSGGSGGSGSGDGDDWNFSIDDLCGEGISGVTQVCDDGPLTLDDFRFFRVSPGAALMEPDGWAVEDLPTNFYSEAPVQVLTGEVLGKQTWVRFTPVGYVWTYGDGSTATLGDAGATWEEQHVREFSPTATSHTYDSVGRYTITLSIAFAAEYHRASPTWIPVSGTLLIPANDLHLRVGSADTVLVGEGCETDPNGPGC